MQVTSAFFFSHLLPSLPSSRHIGLPTNLHKPGTFLTQDLCTGALLCPGYYSLIDLPGLLHLQLKIYGSSDQKLLKEETLLFSISEVGK